MHYLDWFPCYQFCFLILPPYRSHSVISSLLSDNVAMMSFFKSVWFSTALKQNPKPLLPSGPKQSLLFNPILFYFYSSILAFQPYCDSSGMSLTFTSSKIRYISAVFFSISVSSCLIYIMEFQHRYCFTPESLRTTFSPRAGDRLLTLSCHTLAYSLIPSLTFSVINISFYAFLFNVLLLPQAMVLYSL